LPLASRRSGRPGFASDLLSYVLRDQLDSFCSPWSSLLARRVARAEVDQAIVHGLLRLNRERAAARRTFVSSAMTIHFFSTVAAEM